MNSFKQIDSQQIDLRVENLRIDGRTASAQIVAPRYAHDRRPPPGPEQHADPAVPENRRRLVHRRVNGLGLELHCSSLVLGSSGERLADKTASFRGPSVAAIGCTSESVE